MVDRWSPFHRTADNQLLFVMSAPIVIILHVLWYAWPVVALSGNSYMLPEFKFEIICAFGGILHHRLCSYHFMFNIFTNALEIYISIIIAEQVGVIIIMVSWIQCTIRWKININHNVDNFPWSSNALNSMDLYIDKTFVQTLVSMGLANEQTYL